MKDNIAVGAMAGVIAGAIGMAFSYIVFLLGFSPMSSVHLAASLVVIDVINLTPLGFISSMLAHLTVAASFGVIVTYILLYTGKDFWVLKGLGFGAFFCLVTHSYFIPLMRTDAQVRTLIFNAPSWATMVTTHSIIGLIAATVIVRYHYLLKNQEPLQEKNHSKSYYRISNPISENRFTEKKIRIIKPKKLS